MGHDISIHALVKRATFTNHDKNTTVSISIHALVKRATGINAKGDIIKGISIHALVKRATGDSFKHNKQARYFNPRPREEGDFYKWDKMEVQGIFQSTPS